MSKFQVSEEFKAHEAVSQQAFQEAAQAEQGAGRNVDLPPGTRGRCCIVGGTANKGQPKVVNGQPQPAKSYVLLEVEIQAPQSHVGRKYTKYFDLTDHPQYPESQKLCDMWDWMMDAGCPLEVRRSGSIQNMFAWAQQQLRSFDFIVETGFGNRNQIKSVPPLGPLPTGNLTQQALNQAPQPSPQQAPAYQAPPTTPTPPPYQGGVQVGSKVMAYGREMTVESIEGTDCTLRDGNGNQVPRVNVSSVTLIG